MSSSNLSFDPLHHPSTLSSLQTLTRILETSIGPTGKLKLMENTRQLTSSSPRLLNHISIKNIFSKIIVSTAKTQLGTFNDGGLFCSLLILKLVCPMASDNGRSLPLIGTLYEHFAVEFLSFLKKESSFVVDFSDLRHLKSIVLTILSSKPGCLLSHWDREHICSLLLRAFLDSIPSNKSARIQDCFRFLTVDGLPTKESRLLKGVLIQIPETDEKWLLAELTRLSGGPITLALFTCSLAGDTDWPVGGLETTSLDLVIGSTMQLLDNVVSQLVSDKINFVFCQKVVHPRMKKRLQKAGTMVLDRMGSEAAKCIQYICGGTSIASLSCKMSYSTISNIDIEHLGRKSFLLLMNDDTPLFSIVLAHCNEEASAELKVVCRQAMDSLLRILQNPRVCFGGGCSEIRTGLFLANKVRNNLDTIKKETGCTAGQILESLNTFLRATANTCVAIHQGKALDFATESTHGHLWKLQDGHFPTAGHRCQCGSHEAALVDPTSWSFLSDIQHLGEAIPPTSISSEKPSVKVSNTLPITNESFEYLNYSMIDVQHEAAVSCKLISTFQLPTNSSSSLKCKPLSNLISSKSETTSWLSTISTSTCVPLSKTVPACQLSTNVNSLTNAPLSNDMPACQLSTNISSSTTYAPLPSTIPACQLLPNDDTSPSSASSIYPGVTSSSRSSQSTPGGNKPIHLDELTCKLNSLSLAFETAALLLRTTVCINNLPS